MTAPLKPITIRPAYADDASAVARLAALDSAPIPTGPMLVAEVDGELYAALSLADGGVIADPFHLTRLHVELLRTHASAQRQNKARPRTRQLQRLRLA